MHYVVINTRTGNIVGLATESLEQAKADAHKLHDRGYEENGTKVVLGVQKREVIYTPQSLDEAMAQHEASLPAPVKPPYPREIRVIATDIRKHWRPVNFAAKPYLDAMFSLEKITDSYYQDSAASIVRYFLSNSTSWRGAEARHIKAELKQMLGDKVKA